MSARSEPVVFETRTARLTDLPALQRAVEHACANANAPEQVRNDVRLAVEEAFTNIVVHGYPDDRPGPVRCSVHGEPGALVVRLEDDADPWNPTNVPAPPLAAAWSEREIGGLGWHLIRASMDEVRHAQRTPRGNALTLVKRWTP